MPNQTETQTNEKEEKKVSPEKKLVSSEYVEPENDIETKKKIPTVKERIDTTIDKYHQDTDELKKQIFQLVQRILYPDQFCPECDERMFFNSDANAYTCPNCNYTAPVAVKNVAIAPTPTRPGVRPQAGTVPPQVENAIAEAEKATRETAAPTAIGDKIRKLVADRDAGGMSGPTREDEMRVKGSSSNVANEINWV